MRAIVTILLLSTIVSYGSGCSRIDLSSYYIKKGKLANYKNRDDKQFIRERKKSVNLLLEGHYIESGNSLILLVRKFDRGSLFAVDDEIFEKITIEVHNHEDGEPIKLDSKNINIYYSAGASGFIYRGDGEYASKGFGSIVIQHHDKNKLKLLLDINVYVKPSNPSSIDKERTIRLTGEYILSEISVDELTPWLGLPDPLFGNEAYP